MWSGTVYSITNADGTESEYLNLPASLPPGTKYFTYQVSGPEPYPLSEQPVADSVARTKELRGKGYTFKNTTPFGGHHVGQATSPAAVTVSEAATIGKQLREQQQKPPAPKSGLFAWFRRFLPATRVRGVDSCAKCGGSFVWSQSFKSGPIRIPADVIDKLIYCPTCDTKYCIKCVRGACPVCGGTNHRPG